MSSSFSQVGKEAPAVLVENVCQSYSGGGAVLKNIFMKVENSTVYGFLGSSGCGKTTLLGCLLGLKSWQYGRIKVLGEEVKRDGKTLQNLKIGYMPQDYALQEKLTPVEIIHCYGAIYGISKREIKRRWNVLGKLLNMTELKHSLVSELSGGQKRRVSLALALIHNPQLLILDEPTVGLDPLLRARIWDYLYAMTKRNVTILVTTHYVEELKRSHTVGVMRNGRLIAEEEPKNLIARFNSVDLQQSVLQACRQDKHFPKMTLNTLSIDSSIDSNFNGCLRTIVDLKNSKDFFLNLQHLFLTISTSCRRTYAYLILLILGMSRDKALITMVFFVPLFQILTTLSVVGVEPSGLQFGIINKELASLNFSECSHDNGSFPLAGCLLALNLNKTQSFEQIHFQTRSQAETAVSLGKLWGYLEIPDNYTKSLMDRVVDTKFAQNETISGTIVNLRMDQSNIVITQAMYNSVQKSMFTVFHQLGQIHNVDVSFTEIPLESGPPIYGKDTFTARDYAAPVLTLLIPLEVGYALAPYMLLEAKFKQTLERGIVAGLKISEFLVAITVAILPFTMAQSFLSYFTLEYILSFDILCSPLYFLAIWTIASICGTGLGLLVGTIFLDLLTCVIILLTSFPILAIWMGAFRPVECFPYIVRIITSYMPSVTLAESLRSAWNRGVDPFHNWVWPGLATSLGWIGISYCFCVLLRKRLVR